eukprot:11520948-Heterocapsa_arctica.AAC.1
MAESSFVRCGATVGDLHHLVEGSLEHLVAGGEVVVHVGGRQASHDPARIVPDVEARVQNGLTTGLESLQRPIRFVPPQRRGVVQAEPTLQELQDVQALVAASEGFAAFHVHELPEVPRRYEACSPIRGDVLELGALQEGARDIHRSDSQLSLHC